MKILWISCLAWKKQGKYPYPVNGTGAISGSLFQQSMIEGLEKLGCEIDIICDYPYKDCRRTNNLLKWSHNSKSQDVIIKSINIPYISLLFKSIQLTKAVKERIKKEKYDFAIAYLIHEPYLEALSIVKKYSLKTKTILICPDLPDMMDMSIENKKIKKMLKKIDIFRINKLYSKIDAFVLFTERMREKIKLDEKPYIVIEGIASIEDLNVSPLKKEKYYIYAGTLHKNIGIEQIISSIDYVEDKQLKLLIFGTGELEKYVINASEKNSRIIYGGFIDRKTLFEYQKKAIALINARNPNDDYTRYSFPSKTFEYLYSGTPFITTKLKGIPEEYSEYFYEIEDNDPKTIASMINSICKLNEFDKLKKGNQAQNFIKNKNAVAQAKKLRSFCIRLKGGENDET